METFVHETMLSDISLCDQLIEYHKNNMEYKDKGRTAAGVGIGKISTDVRVFPVSTNPIVIMYMSEIVSAVKKYCEKYHIQYMMKVGIKEPFNIQYYAPNEGFFNWHCERSCYQSNQRALVFMTYLNDVSDGGETEFYYQKLKVRPRKGRTIIAPAYFTHTHRGNINTSGVDKFILTGWSFLSQC